MNITVAHWHVILLTFTAFVTGGPAVWLALRPSRTASRLGMRGLKRQRALLNPTWASIDPLVRWMAKRIGGVVDDKTHDKIDKFLTHAGDFMGISPDELVALVGLGAIGGGLSGLGLATYSERWTFLIPLLMVFGGALPYLVVDMARVRRFQEINRGLPYAIDLVSLAMSAGLDFPGGIGQVVAKAKANEALKEELGYMLQQLQLGRTRAQVLKELAERVPIDAVKEFSSALLQAEERGTPVAQVLEIQASTARTRRTNIAENAAEKMKAKMVIPIWMIVGLTIALVAFPTSMLIQTLTKGGGLK